jgi:hypothetical protein
MYESLMGRFNGRLFAAEVRRMRGRPWARFPRWEASKRCYGEIPSLWDDAMQELATAVKTDQAVKNYEAHTSYRRQHDAVP